MVKENHTIRFYPETWKQVESRAQENGISAPEYIDKAISIELSLEKLQLYKGNSQKTLETLVGDALEWYVDFTAPLYSYIEKHKGEETNRGTPYSP